MARMAHPGAAVVMENVELRSSSSRSSRCPARAPTETGDGAFYVDRNPQRYVDSIFAAKEADYVKATQRVARSHAAPSAVILPILALP
jgi:hypothetical protein